MFKIFPIFVNCLGFDERRVDMKKNFFIFFLIIAMTFSGVYAVESENLVSFSDMQGHWAESFVNDATKLGLFKGDEQGKFNPDENVTRAQFVTVLWRMEGSPVVDIAVPFTDISNQPDEFKTAIAWGYSNGYINGESDTKFEPEGVLTREAGMKILHYYSGGMTGGELQFMAIYDGLFKDSSEISQWAKKSVYWGVYQKLLSGTSSNTLSPKDTATRGQLAKILINYINFI